jgi:hypothetical protein
MELVRDARLVDELQAALKRNFIRRARRLRRTVVAANLTEPCTIYWDADFGVWGHFRNVGTHYWNPFGVDDPTRRENVVNSVQINPSRDGKLNTGGAFLWDAASEIAFLAHSGRLGGKSVGEQERFLRFCDTVEVTVNGIPKQYIVISAIEDAQLNENIARFVALAASFKSSGGARSATHKGPLRRDEYTGAISYERKGYVETVRWHGRVVKALKSELQRRGLTVHRDVNRDLYCKARGVPILFEVKANATLHDVYTAVGQLLIHGTASDSKTRCVLVAPSVQPDIKAKLRALKLQVLTYREVGTGFRFDGLDRVC